MLTRHPNDSALTEPWAVLASGSIVRATDGWQQITTWTGTYNLCSHAAGQITLAKSGLYAITAQVDVTSSGRAVLAYDKDTQSGAYAYSTQWLVDTGIPSLATDQISAAGELVGITQTLRIYAFLTAGTHSIRLQIGKL